MSLISITPLGSTLPATMAPGTPTPGTPEKQPALAQVPQVAFSLQPDPAPGLSLVSNVPPAALTDESLQDDIGEIAVEMPDTEPPTALPQTPGIALPPPDFAVGTPKSGNTWPDSDMPDAMPLAGVAAPIKPVAGQGGSATNTPAPPVHHDKIPTVTLPTDYGGPADAVTPAQPKAPAGGAAPVLPTAVDAEKSQGATAAINNIETTRTEKIVSSDMHTATPPVPGDPILRALDTKMPVVSIARDAYFADMAAPLHFAEPQFHNRIGVPGTAPMPQTVPPHHAHPIAQQLVAAVSRHDADRIELRLDPPELGRVTIHMQITDGEITAHVTTERAEIADLMRRHAEVLARELARAGLTGATLSFGSQDHRDPQSAPQHQAQARRFDVANVAAEMTTAASLAADGSLDIRL